MVRPVLVKTTVVTRAAARTAVLNAAAVRAAAKAAASRAAARVAARAAAVNDRALCAPTSSNVFFNRKSPGLLNANLFSADDLKKKCEASVQTCEARIVSTRAFR